MLSFEMGTDKSNLDRQVVLVKKGNRVLAIISPDQDGIEIKNAGIEEVKAEDVANDVEIEVSLLGKERKVGTFTTDEDKIKVKHAPAKGIEIKGGVRKLKLKLS